MLPRLRIILFVGVAFLIAPFVKIVGQTPYYFENYTAREGLSSNNIKNALIDQRGYLWLATSDGLDRFDGTTTKVFRHDLQNTRSIGGNYAKFIAQAPDSTLWIATEDNGLAHYQPHQPDNQAFTNYQHDPQNPQSIGSNELYTVLVTRNNTVYVGGTQGLDRLNPRTQKFEHLFTASVVFFLYATNDSTIFVGTRTEGVVIVHSNRPNTAQIEKLSVNIKASATVLLNTENAFGSFATPDGKNIYTGSQQLGLLRYNLARHAFEQTVGMAKLSQQLGTGGINGINALITDPQGNIWVAHAIGGLGIYNPTTDSYTHIPSQSLLHGDTAHTSIQSLTRDQRGTIWIGTAKKGLIKYDPAHNQFPKLFSFTHTKNNPTAQTSPNNSTDDATNANRVRSIATITPQHYWILTNTALLRYSTTTEQVEARYQLPKGVANELKIVAVVNQTPYLRSDHGLWTLSNNTHHTLEPIPIAANTPQQKATRAAFQKADIGAAVADTITTQNNTHTTRQYVLWVGSWSDGLYLYDLITHSVTLLTSRIPARRIITVTRDRAGTIWLGADYDGLIRIDDKTFTAAQPCTQFRSAPNNPTALPNNDVLALYPAPNGTLWVATYGGGLTEIVTTHAPNRANLTRLRSYSTTEGLTSTTIYGIHPDGLGGLWLELRQGLAHFDTHTRRFRNYALGEGIVPPSSQPFSCHHDEAAKLLLLGFVGYFRAIRTADIAHDTIPPNVELTKFRVFENDRTELLLQPSIELSYHQNFFSFEFAAIAFTDPTRCRYQYKLEGYDDDWVQADTRRFAYYTNVGGGSYRFRVRACNPDGVWNERGTAIALRIIPPFWQTLWFRGIIAVLFAAAAYSAIRLYTAQQLRTQRTHFERQQAIERERTRIAVDMHDDLGAGLTTIRLWSEILRMKLPAQLNYPEIQKISTSSADLVTRMGEIVWAMNSKNDTLESLIAYIRAYTAEFFDPTDIICRIQTPETLPTRTLSGEQRRNIFLTVKETLNNTLKHANATHVTVTVSLNDDTLTIVIHDNGKGIDLTALRAFGNGLKNMQQRIAAIGGTYSIENDSGTRTTIIVECGY